MKIGERIKELRFERGVTQEGLATAIHVSRSTIAKWESGRGTPTKESIIAICEYFNLSEESLLNKNGIKNKRKIAIISAFIAIVSLLSIIIPTFLLKEDKPTAEELKELTPKITALYTVPKSGLIDSGLKFENGNYILSSEEWNLLYFDVEMDERLVVSWFEFSIEFYDCETFMIERISSHYTKDNLVILSYCAYVRPQNQEVSRIEASNLSFSYVYEGMRYEKDCIIISNSLSVKVKEN